MGSVKIKDVRKSYGSVDVIHGIDVDINEGEFVVLVGPSGCGKSTLLRMVAGLEDISGGEIAIDDRRVNELEPKDRDIAMVFQNYALYPQMTVAQNMGFALEMQGKAKAQIKEEVAKAADILSLTPLLDRKPAQLSGGQRQRVAMGRAIVRHPKVFLFDEPLSNLDAKLRVQMRAEIKALHQRLGTTIMYVTHDQIEAMTMADKIVVLHGGHVEQVGSPLDLFDRPRNLFVAGFLGSPAMNLLPVKGVAGGVDFSGVTLPSDKAQVGGDYVYGIRPDDVAIGQGPVTATVNLVEPTGTETHLSLSVAGHSIMAVTRDRLTLRSGETIQIDLSHGNTHLFDKGSGLRL